MKITLSYLYPDPSKDIKFYQLRTTTIEIEFLKRLINIDGFPYYENSLDPEMKTRFMSGQYTYKQIQKIIGKYDDKM